MWTDDQLRVLIDERKENNEDYHNLNNNMRCNFWKSLASKINIKFGTDYSGKKCKDKFQSLIREHKVY